MDLQRHTVIDSVTVFQGIFRRGKVRKFYRKGLLSHRYTASSKKKMQSDGLIFTHVFTAVLLISKILVILLPL